MISNMTIYFQITHLLYFTFWKFHEQVGFQKFPTKQGRQLNNFFKKKCFKLERVEDEL